MNCVGEGICPACKKPCAVYSEDVGIGPYEFWGATGVDSRIMFLSYCCDEEMEEFVHDEPDYEEDEHAEDT